jgi:hypothetical protein
MTLETEEICGNEIEQTTGVDAVEQLHPSIESHLPSKRRSGSKEPGEQLEEQS